MLEDGRTVLNFCANNYLGLADIADSSRPPRTRSTATACMASVRFIAAPSICTSTRRTIAEFFGTEDTILYAACFDANGGLYEPLLGEEDAVISDALNHASIIDGVRLCKAKRYRYGNCDMTDLEKQLQAADAAGARTKLISSDGVFSMDGFIAPLDETTALASQYGALVHIDECHATGFLGAHGRGSAEVKGVLDRIDIFTGTLGKAMGGALGGLTTTSEKCRVAAPESRPTVSNSLRRMSSPDGIKASHAAVRGDLRARLADNTAYFRERMTVPASTQAACIRSSVIALRRALAQKFAARLRASIYAMGSSTGGAARQARIRTSQCRATAANA